MANPVSDVKNKMPNEIYESGPRLYLTYAVATISYAALFGIAYLAGTVGGFPSSTFGWITVGLTGATVTSLLAYGRLKDRKWVLLGAGLLASALIAMGTLGGFGTLSTMQMVWGFIGTSLVGVPLILFLVNRDKKVYEKLKKSSPHFSPPL